jgi:hypothetical protein
VILYIISPLRIRRRHTTVIQYTSLFTTDSNEILIILLFLHCVIKVSTCDCCQEAHQDSCYAKGGLETSTMIHPLTWIRCASPEFCTNRKGQHLGGCDGSLHEGIWKHDCYLPSSDANALVLLCNAQYLHLHLHSSLDILS